MIRPRATTPVRAFSSRVDAARLSDDPGRLPRVLGLFSTTMLVVGGIIGSGIFFTPAEVARAVPSGAWILLAWLLGGVIAVAGALTYAELGAVLPEAGGAYAYIREAFGRRAAFLCGWMTLLLIATGAEAAVAMGFGHYLSQMIPGVLPPPIALATAIVVAVTAINYFGIRPGVVAQNVFTVAKLIALAAIIIGGLVLWARVAPASVANAPAPRSSIVIGMAAAIVPVLFTIGGWQQMNMVGAEVREPTRTIPRALMLGIAIVVVVYLSINVVYLHALGRDGLAMSRAVAADTAFRYFGTAGRHFVTIAALISIVGFLNVVMVATPRILFAMARDGVFFERAGQVHPRWQSPHIAILAIGAWTLVLLFASGGRIDVLLSGVVFADWIFFALGAASVFVLRKTYLADERPYSVPGYPWVPGFFVGCAVAAVVAAIVSSPRMSLFGFALLAAGVGVERWITRKAGRGIGDPGTTTAG